MRAHPELWIEQCDAARSIRERLGLEKALGYLIGEKLLEFVKVADEQPDFSAELPAFLDEVRDIFTEAEIWNYLATVRRVGVFGHVGTEEEVATLREAGAIHEDPVEDAEDILVVERLKEMLLP
jgi:hypothetical protein